MYSNLIIRPEQTQDITVIFNLTQRAFEQAEHSSHTEQFIVNALRAAGHLSISLVAELDGQIVGHIAFSPVQLSSGAAHWYGLGPVSVIPELQHQGIGTQLIQTGLQQLQRIATGCVLLGEPDYYQRFGFQAVPDLSLEGVPPEYFQALLFQGEMPQAQVKYSDAFAASQ